VESDLVWREVRTALDEELKRLPERLRLPLLLCYLSGLTRDEAAQQLGWSLGTLKRRLEQGRAALRKRLEHRGIAAAGLALAVMSPSALDAAVGPALAKSCLDAVFGREVAAGVSALILTTTTSFKGVAMKAIIVSLALVGLGVGIYASFGHADQPKPADEKKSEEPKATAKRVDALGDALPDGAIMRLGTRRFREEPSPWHYRPVYWQHRPDGKSHLVVHRNGNGSEIRLIDSKTGVIVESWAVPKHHVEGFGEHTFAGEVVAFSPDGRYVLLTNDYVHHGLVDSAQEWHFTLYDLTKRKEVWSIAKKLEPQDWPTVGKCAFSADGKWFVTGPAQSQEDSKIHLWDARNGKLVWEHASKGQSLSPIGFVNDGETVVLRGDKDGTIHLFDRAKGTEKKSFSTTPPVSWGQTLLTPDGKHLVICTSQPPEIWDLEGKKVAVLEGHKEWANVAAISPDGKKLYTGCFDSFVVEREFPSGKPIRKIEFDRNVVIKMAVSPDGKRLEAVFEGEQALTFYDLKTGKQLPEPIASHRSAVYGVECAPDGSLISFGSDRSVRTWDLKQGKAVAQIAVNRDLNGCGFALSADGARVAVANDDSKSIGIYERQTGKRLRDIPVDNVSQLHLTFSPDGRLLAAISTSSRAAQVCDVNTGTSLLKVQAASEGNTATGAFSPDGRTFAFASGQQIRAWDTTTWKAGIGIPLPNDWMGTFSLAYSPDGRTVAMARLGGVRLYEVATRRERAHVGDGGWTSGLVRFSHDGRLLAWVNNDNKIHVLDMRTGALAGPITGHDGGITGLAFTIDDKAIASSSGDCTILVWDLSGKTVAKPAPDWNPNEDWLALRDGDAPKAFTAMRALAAHPETALQLASEQLKPVEPVDPQWVAARLRDLDNPKFAERVRATRELEESGDRVAVALEKFLANEPSAEARGRAEKLLEKIRSGATGQTAQSLRALEVLEWIGTSKARELVEQLAKGAEGALLTEEAKRNLKKWKSSGE
jgi:WD40 repeat protein